MSNNVDKPAISASDRKDGDIESDAPGTPPMKMEDIEKVRSSEVVDKETEARLLRKLDIRIIPMICWIYLMNFMDRGTGALALLLQHANYSSKHRQC